MFILMVSITFFFHRNKAEMSHTCRGTICLNGATIDIADSCTFVISNGSTQSFHLRAANEVERQRWVTALELAKSKCYKNIESGKYLFDTIKHY